mgnify:CR=1 FL=1
MIEQLMPAERTRPSLLPLQSLFTMAVIGCNVVCGAEKTELLLSGVEKGMQAEHDE